MKSVSEIREEIADACDEAFGLPGYKDYIESNLGAAAEVMRYGGNMYDLDAIVALEDLLHIHVSYDMYSYIDGKYDERALTDLTKDDLPDLWRYIRKYAKI